MCEDVRDFLTVSTADTVQHVKNYNKAVRCIEMKVCGVCAVRDPEVAYVEIALRSIQPGHWLNLSDMAKQQLVDALPVHLVSATGETLVVEQCEFHHIFKDGDRWMHVVPREPSSSSSPHRQSSLSRSPRRPWQHDIVRTDALTFEVSRPAELMVTSFSPIKER